MYSIGYNLLLSLTIFPDFTIESPFERFFWLNPEWYTIAAVVASAYFSPSSSDNLFPDFHVHSQPND